MKTDVRRNSYQIAVNYFNIVSNVNWNVAQREEITEELFLKARQIRLCHSICIADEVRMTEIRRDFSWLETEKTPGLHGIPFVFYGDESGSGS